MRVWHSWAALRATKRRCLRASPSPSPSSASGPLNASTTRSPPLPWLGRSPPLVTRGSSPKISHLPTSIAAMTQTPNFPDGTHQVQEPLRLCRPVPDRVGPTTSRPAHSPDGGPRSWVQWEEQRDALGRQVRVEVFPFHARLDRRRAVGGGDGEDGVHVGGVEGDAAEGLCERSERSECSKRSQPSEERRGYRMSGYWDMGSSRCQVARVGGMSEGKRRASNEMERGKRSRTDSAGR